MTKQKRYVVGLDIGTSKISCIVGAVREDHSIDIVGLGDAPSPGLRKGVVVNTNATVDSIKNACDEAELMAGVSIESATVGIAGGHVRSFNSRGVVAVSGGDRTVTREDIRRVMDAAKAVSIPRNYEILHVLPQKFVLDEQGGIAAPEGLVGSRLEVNVHIVIAATTSIQNLVTCANRAGIEVREVVLGQLAVAEAVLTDDEHELGILVIDIGGGTTDLAIFEKGSIWQIAALPVGGDQFTNDLAVGLRSPIPDTDRLETTHGCALASMIQQNEPIEVPTIGGRRPRLLSLQVMAEILQPRAEEIFNLIRDEITQTSFEKSLNAGIVLTGGGSLLPGMTELAEQVFGTPVRLGLPSGAESLIEPTTGPRYATAIGLAKWGAHSQRPPRPPFLVGRPPPNGSPPPIAGSCAMPVPWPWPVVKAVGRRTS